VLKSRRTLVVIEERGTTLINKKERTRLIYRQDDLAGREATLSKKTGLDKKNSGSGDECKQGRSKYKQGRAEGRREWAGCHFGLALHRCEELKGDGGEKKCATS